MLSLHGALPVYWCGGWVFACASHVGVLCEGRPVRLRLSVARALKVYVSATKSLTPALYGAVVSASSNVVPLKNSTLLMLPSVSLAVADSVQLHNSVWVGSGSSAVVGSALTTTGTDADVVLALPLSVATAVRVYDP